MRQNRENDDLIARVHDGMAVVDRAGEHVGVVEQVRMGDPEAVTTRGQQTDSPTPLTRLARAGFEEPKVTGELAEHLRRIGFVKIDRHDVFDRDLYAAADQIADIDDGDTVHLAVSRDDLLTEAL